MRGESTTDKGRERMQSQKEEAPKRSEEPMVRTLADEPVQEEQDMKTVSTKVVIGVYVALVLLGVGTGYVLSRGVGGVLPGTANRPKMEKTDKVVGITDTKTFKDSAEGVIEKGGMDGEGTHKLIREGGPSQTAYLISSVVDMDEYAGKKVRVWGQTMAAKKASWLMDVGKIELLSE